MKKFICSVLAVSMLFALGACGKKGDAAGETEKAATIEDVATSTTWVEIYSGYELKVNTDNTAKYNDKKGEWSVAGDEIDITYTVNNYNGGTTEKEIVATVVEDNGFTILKSEENGTERSKIFVAEADVEKYLEAIAIPVGDEFATDIASFTLNNAPLSIYSVGASTSTSDKHTTNMDVCLLPNEGTDDYCFFKASRGHALVCLDFTVTNNDRTSLDIGGSFSSTITFGAIIDGKYTTVQGYDLNNDDGYGSMNLAYSPMSVDGGKTYYTNDTSNKLLGAGIAAQIRVINIASEEPADYDAPYYLIVRIKDSSDVQHCAVYVVK